MLNYLVFARFFCAKVLEKSQKKPGGNMKEEQSAFIERRNSSMTVKSDGKLSINAVAQCFDQVFH